VTGITGRTPLGALASPALARHARAEAFRDAPVRLIAPYPAGDSADFMARAMSRSSASIGSSLQVAIELLKLRAGLDRLYVPDGDPAPAVTDLSAGAIELLTADFPALLGQDSRRGGRARGC
jgi:tripartite-type tricarboxylate transporter receptor subunit TctC